MVAPACGTPMREKRGCGQKAGKARERAGTKRRKEDGAPWRRNVVMRTLIQCCVMSPPTRAARELAMDPDHTPQEVQRMLTRRGRCYYVYSGAALA